MKLTLTGDHARITELRATDKFGARVTVEIDAKPEFVRELDCAPYVAAERSAYESIVARWQREHKVPWDDACARVKTQHEAAVRVARLNGDPTPPEPKPPELEPCPTPVESSRVLSEVSQSIIGLWLDFGDAALRVAGSIAGKPKLVTAGFASVVVLKVDVRVLTAEDWVTMRSRIDDSARVFGEQRDIEEVVRERDSGDLFEDALGAFDVRS